MPEKTKHTKTSKYKKEQKGNLEKNKKKTIPIYILCIFLLVTGSLFIVYQFSKTSVAESSDYNFSDISSTESSDNRTSVPGPDFQPETLVKIYSGRKDNWEPATYSDVEPGQEFIHKDVLYYVHPQGVLEMCTTVDVNKLPEADRAFEKDNSRMPEAEDVVRLTDDAMKHVRHVVLRHIRPGQSFIFQGREFHAKQSSSGGLAVAPTGRVLAMVTNTFKTESDDVHALTIRDSQANDYILNVTSEHPFFVPAADDYVPLKNLNPGDELLTSDNEDVTVVSIEKLPGVQTVYNIEVDGPNNYYVSPPGGGPSVLVHNKAQWNKGFKSADALRKHNKEVGSLVKKYKLTKDQQRSLHDVISGEGHTRKEIEQIIKDMFDKY